MKKADLIEDQPFTVFFLLEQIMSDIQNKL